MAVQLKDPSSSATPPDPKKVSAAAIIIPNMAAPALAGDRIITTLTEQDYWLSLGFIKSSTTSDLHLGLLDATVPEGVVLLQAKDASKASAMTDVLKAFGEPPLISIQRDGVRQSFFRMVNDHLIQELGQALPADVTLSKPGDAIELPVDHESEHVRISVGSLSELSVLTAKHVQSLRAAHAPPPARTATSNPLNRYSLRGRSKEFEHLAVHAEPLLGDLCLTGQVTAWYAAPNTGKTLIALSLLVEAVREDRINPANVFYLAADDNSAGLADKMRLLDDLGCHTIVPGWKEFKSADLSIHLKDMAARDEARGVLIIVDTTKKFVSLMDKKESSAFADACRQVAMRGGAVLNLAHTTKSANQDGSPRYAGTTDLVDDADAAYTIATIAGVGDIKAKAVEFRCFKSRGANAPSAGFTYTTEGKLPYDELLASVQPIDIATIDEFKRVEADVADAEGVATIKACIADGYETKMLLAREAARRVNTSTRAIVRLLERYTGADPAIHHWNFQHGERGKQLFRPLIPPPPDTPVAA